MQELFYNNSGGERMNKKLILISLCVILSTTAVQAACSVQKTEDGAVVKIEQPDFAYTLMDKIRKDRTTIYNALNLTPSQLECTRELEKARYEELEPLIFQLCKEKSELKSLECSKASKAQILAKKHKSENTKREIKKVSSKYDKKFEKILNHEQTDKYEMVKKLRRQDLKKYQKIQKYGSKQTELKPFGCKVSQPAYQQQVREENSILNKCKKVIRK